MRLEVWALRHAVWLTWYSVLAQKVDFGIWDIYTSHLGIDFYVHMYIRNYPQSPTVLGLIVSIS